MHRVSNPPQRVASASRRLSLTFVVKPDYTAAAVPPDSSLANDPATPRLGDLWRVGWQEKQRLEGSMPHGEAVQLFRRVIRANGGDSWCICMWAFARMVEAVGCEHVHLRCNATDVDFVLASYQDRGVTGRVHDLTDAHSCMKQKCLEADGGFAHAPHAQAAQASAPRASQHYGFAEL
eukprot:g10995.t1